jgi:hypothetical protein
VHSFDRLKLSRLQEMKAMCRGTRSSCLNIQYPLEEAPCALDEAKAGRCKCNVRLETV